ncbi:MAG: toprim domain-containing protein [Bacteroidales bacterium]
MSLTDIKKNISIVDYLATKGITPTRLSTSQAMFKSPLRKDTNASFSVDLRKNLWYDHGMAQGGSILDLVSICENCSIAEAISKLESQSFSFRRNEDFSSERKREEDSLQGIKITAKKELSHPALVRYVLSRSISLEIAKKHLSQIHYSVHGKENYFSLGFQNNNGGYELRNLLYKNCLGQKDVTFFENHANTLLVFEGFFDFLSYLSMPKVEMFASAKNTENFLILNSTAMKKKAMPILDKHSRINLFLDNDNSGTILTEEFIKAFPKSAIDYRNLYKNFKDFNEYWVDKNIKNKRKFRR